MDPVTLAILTSVAGTALSNAGTLSKTDLEKANEDRLKKLKARQAQGGLGLTEREEAAIRGRLSAGAQRQQEYGQDERNRLLAGGGAASGGQALEQAVASEEQRMALQTDIADKVLEADLAEKEREKEELAALQAARSQEQVENRNAVGSILGAGLEAGLTESKNQAIIQGQKDVSPAAVSGLATTLGVSEEEARGLFELAIENPEMMKYFSMLGAQQ